MSTHIDAAAVRQFIEIISEHVQLAINGAGPPGVLQICRINPIDESAVPSRFLLNDVEHMVKTAVDDATAGHNGYIEARTVRADLRGNQRGTFADTAWVFGLVADGDADKGKGGSITVRPSLVIETSPGNFHYWYLFTRAIPADQARIIGDAIRAGTDTDHDTGVITQCYRVAGIILHPQSKRAAASPSSRPVYSSRPDDCGIQTNCSGHSGRPPHRQPRQRLPRPLAALPTRPPCRMTYSRTSARAASARRTTRAARHCFNP